MKKLYYREYQDIIPKPKARVWSTRVSVLLGIMLFSVFGVKAATYTWTGTSGTAWATAGNWSPSGNPGSSAGDIVIIPVGTNQPLLTVAPLNALASLTFTGNATLTITGVTLSVTGAVANTTSATTGTVTGSGTLTCGSVSIGTGAALTFGSVVLNVTGTTAVGGTSGTITFNNTSGLKTFTGQVTINSGATWTESAAVATTFSNGISNSGTFTASTGVHTFATNAQGLTGTFTMPSVTVTGIVLTNNGTLSVGTALTGTGTFNNGASGTLNITGGTSSVTTLTNAGTVAFSSTSASSTAVANFTNTGILNITGSGTIAGITNSTGGTVNHSGSSTITSFNNSTSTSTLFISTTPTVPTFGTLTATVAGNTVNYSGAGPQTVKVVVYSNLVLSGSGAKTCAVTSVTKDLTLSGTATASNTAVLTVGGNLSVNGGTFTQSLAMTITGNLTLGGGNFTTTSTAGTTFTVSGSTTITTGTLSVPASTSNKTFTGLITLNGGTMSGTCATLILGGGITNNSGTVSLTGAATMSTAGAILSGANPIAIATLTVTSPGTVTNSTTVSISSTLGGTGTCTNGTSGTLNITGVTSSITTLANAGTVAISGSATSTTAVGSFTNTGILNITGSGTIAGITNSTGGVVNHSGSSTITSFNNATSTSTLFISTTPTVPTFNTLTVSAAGNTVNYNGAGPQTVQIVAYSNLILSGSGAKTFAVTSVTKDLTLSGTATVTNTAVLAVGGNMSVNGGAFTQSFAMTIAASLTLGGGNLTTTTTAATAFTVSGATTITSGTLSVAASTSNKTFTGMITLNGGTMSGACATLVLGAGMTNNSGTVSLTGTATMSTAGAILSGANPIAIATLTVTSPGTVTNSGTVTISTTLSGNGTCTNGASGTLNITGGISSVTTFANGGIITISGSAASSTAVGNFTNTGTLNITGAGGIVGITNSTGGVVNHSGTSTVTTFNNATSTSTLFISTTPTVPIFTTLTVSAAGNTVNYNGAGPQNVQVVAYSNLIMSGSGAKTCAVTSVTKDLTVSGSATATNTAVLAVGGNVSINGGTFTQGKAMTITGNLTLGGGNFTTTSTAATVFTVSGTTMITSGTLSVAASTSNKTFTGLITLNGGTMSGACVTIVLGTGIANNIGTVSLSGMATMSTAGAIFSGTNPTAIATLTVTSPGTVTNSGTVAISTALGGTGIFTNGDGTSGTLSIGGTCGITTFTTTATNNTVKYTGTGQTILALSYYNLDLSGSVTPSSLSGSYIIAGAFTPGSTVSPAPGTSTIAFTGTGQTIPAFTYNNLTISGTTTPVLVNGGTITITGVFTPGSVVPTVTNNTMAFTGTAQTIPAFTYNNLILNGTGIATVVGIATVNGNMTISGNTLSINPAVTLSVSGTITTDGNVNTIYIHSSPTLVNGSLIFHNTAGSPVSATVEMYSRAWKAYPGQTYQYQWQFFGVPVSSIAASPVFDGSWVRQYDETLNVVNGKWTPLTNLSVLTPFTGYELTQDVTKTIVFQGQLVNQDITITLPTTTGVPEEGQHVMANPYTAAIDIRQLSFGSDTEATVYLYNTGSFQEWTTNGGDGTYSTSTTTAGQYIAIPQSSAGTGSIPYDIPSMSGFLVKATSESANGSITIPYNSIITKNVSLQRVKQSSTSSSGRTYLEIAVKSEHAGDCMWLINQPGTTRSFDNGWDGYKMFGSVGVPQLYALENTGNFQVSTSENFSDTFLGFQAGEDKEYTLTFKNENLDKYYTNLYLLDLLDNKTVDITKDSTQYTFTAGSTAATAKRFKIVTIPQEKDTLATTSTIRIFASERTVFVNNKDNTTGSLSLYDISGRLVTTVPFGAACTTPIQTSFPGGVYIAKATTGSFGLTERLILR